MEFGTMIELVKILLVIVFFFFFFFWKISFEVKVTITQTNIFIQIPDDNFWRNKGRVMDFDTMVEIVKILLGFVSQTIFLKVKVTITKNRIYHPVLLPYDNFWRNKAVFMKFGTMIEHDKKILYNVKVIMFAWIKLLDKWNKEQW